MFGKNILTKRFFFALKKIKKFGKKKKQSGFFYAKSSLLADCIFLMLAVGLLLVFFFNPKHFLQLKNQNQFEEEVKERPAKKIIPIPVFDTSNWKLYQNKWYGFQFKYPEEWSGPTIKSALKGSSWEYQYQFRTKKSEENNPYAGFDIKIYNTKKIKEFAMTEDYPKIKNEELKNSVECQNVSGAQLENKKYPAELIYINQNDKCFESDYFYYILRDNYIYNIVPAVKEGIKVSIDPRTNLIKNLPDFFSIIDSFDLIDISRPKPKPKITAPKPFVYKVDNLGRMVCDKKNDHPSRSDKNKKRHLDGECCLDPDEIPNPWCYYDPAKYGRYL